MSSASSRSSRRIPSAAAIAIVTSCPVGSRCRNPAVRSPRSERRRTGWPRSRRTPPRGSAIVAEDRDYLIHSWSVQSAISPLPVAGAEGRLFLGLRRQPLPGLRLAARQRLDRPPAPEGRRGDQGAGRPALHDRAADGDRRALASSRRLLAEVTPGDLRYSFFTNGGAEANENAIKLARWVTGRHKVIARYRSYHGATAGAITLTGDPRRWPAEPGIPGVVRMLDPYTYRCPAGHPDPCPVCTGAPHLEELLQYEGADTVAAVILETVTGTNGDHRPARRLPAVDPRGVRPARDRADRRRGDGRLRPHRPLVRRASTGTSSRTSSRPRRGSTPVTCRSAR